MLGTYPDQRGEQVPRELALARPVPIATIVHGDTSSAFAAALAAFHLRIPVAHVEAGPAHRRPEPARRSPRSSTAG